MGDSRFQVGKAAGIEARGALIRLGGRAACQAIEAEPRWQYVPKAEPGNEMTEAEPGNEMNQM